MTNYEDRRNRLHDWLDEKDLDAMVVNSDANVRYLFGFAGEGMALVGAEDVICTDRRFEEEVDVLGEDVRARFHTNGHLAGAIEALKDAGAHRIAFEAESTFYSAYEGLKSKLDDDVEIVPSRKVIEDYRVTKDDAEVERIRRAAAIMDAALDEVSRRLRPGWTEKYVALKLQQKAILGGAEKLAFETICAFGPLASAPHAVPTDCELRDGDMVVIDCGAKVDGYCSDITRTYCVGEPDERLREVYGAVWDAQRAAIDAAHPDMKCSELDAVARDIITQRGFEDEFRHGLGHGVGLCVHEMPKVSRRSKDVLKAGMVITIEPGVYIKGWGGVRIEDTVLITETGCEPLTHAPKQQVQ